MTEDMNIGQISVIVPIYNAGTKLHRCLQSIQRQTYPHWRLLLIDDGSDDGSLAVCQSYAERDERVKLYSQTRSGSIAARRRGIELSNTPYITFVDADDWADIHMLDRLFRAAEQAQADITVCNTYKVFYERAWPKRRNRSHYFDRERRYEGGEIRSELAPAYLHGHPFPASLHGKLYKRELLLSSGSYLSRIHFFGDDLYYNLEMFLKAETVKVIPDSLYYYRAGGMTSRYMPRLFDDIVNGYRIQTEVVERYYSQDRDYHFVGIRLMLLNTLLTCLGNLFLGNQTERERLDAMAYYCAHPVVQECVREASVMLHCDKELIQAIRSGDIVSLYNIGKRRYRMNRPKRILMNAIAKLSF